MCGRPRRRGRQRVVANAFWTTPRFFVERVRDRGRGSGDGGTRAGGCVAVFVFRLDFDSCIPMSFPLRVASSLLSVIVMSFGRTFRPSCLRRSFFGGGSAGRDTGGSRWCVGGVVVQQVSDHAPSACRGGNGGDGRRFAKFPRSDVVRQGCRVNDVREECNDGCVNVTPMSELRGERANRFVGAPRPHCVTQDVRGHFRPVIGDVPKKDNQVGVVANGACRVSGWGRRDRA